jgi:dTDP-4-amino-4,6-dideoxygalactose transaminase
MGQEFGGREGQCPVTERVSEQLLRLPMFSGLSEADQHRVIDAIYDFQMPGTELTSMAAVSAR